MKIKYVLLKMKGRKIALIYIECTNRALKIK